MSIRNLATPNQITLNCGEFNCKDMKCDNMTIETGGDLDAHNITTENDLLVKTIDGKAYIKYNTPTQGNPNDQLTIDSKGECYWSNAAPGGGLSNPLGTDIYMNGFRIYDNQGDTANIFVGPTSIGITGILGCSDKLITASGIDSSGDIDIKAGVLKTAQVSSTTSNLTLTGNNGGLPANVILSGSTTQISCNNGIDMLNHPITNCSLLYSQNLNNVKLIRTESDFQGTNLSGAYMIYGNINMTSGTYTLIGDTTITGIGRDISSLNFNIGDPDPAGFCIVNTNFNLDISNVNMSNGSNEYSLLSCSNTTEDKILTISNASFRDCENATVIQTEGFDLIDLHQVLFQYNNVASRHIYCNSGSKLQISNCEFLRQGTRANPIVSWGTSPMIEIDQTFTPWGALNITGNLIHPQQTQSGIKLNSNVSALEGVLSSNTFISQGLTTGILIDYDGTDINQFPWLIVSDNSGVMNEKALLSASSQGNLTYTATTAGVYVPVDFGASFNVSVDNRFSPTANPFEFKYDGKQPISCLVAVTTTADHDTKGDDTILFALQQNANIVSIIETDIKDGATKSFSLNTVLSLQQNDILKFMCQNTTSGSDSDGFRATSFNGSLVEI